VDEFRNEQVPERSIPHLADEHFEAADKNLLRMSLTVLGIVAVGIVLAAVVLAILTSSRWPVAVGGVLLALTGLAAAFRAIEVRHIGYQVRSHDVSYRRGFLFRTVSTVPFVRVQHAKTRQGPIERRYGLATLDVNSAGPDIHIQGLPVAVAERLKAYVLERAGNLVEPT